MEGDVVFSLNFLASHDFQPLTHTQQRHGCGRPRGEKKKRNES